MKKRRELNVFSMSFLDAITAGFGCVVLLFMLVSQNALLDSRTVVEDLSAEAKRWALKVVTGQKNLVQMKEQLQQQLQQWTALKALRANLVSEIDDTNTKLATETQDSETRKAAIAKLRPIWRHSTSRPRRWWPPPRSRRPRATRCARSQVRATGST